MNKRMSSYSAAGVRIAILTLMVASCTLGNANYDPQHVSRISDQKAASRINYAIRELNTKPEVDSRDVAQELMRKIPGSCLMQGGVVACQSQNAWVNAALAKPLPRLKLDALAIYPDGSFCSANISINNRDEAYSEDRSSAMSVKEKAGRRLVVIRSRTETLRKAGTVELFLKTCSEELGWGQ